MNNLLQKKLSQAVAQTINHPVVVIVDDIIEFYNAKSTLP